MTSTLSRCCLLVSLMICLTAQAQDDGQLRISIENARIRKTEEFDALERACYRKFAVNDCINTVNEQRRLVTTELKRQEETLRASERMLRGAEQLQRTEQKVLEFDQRNAETNAIDPALLESQKLQAQQEKVLQHQAKATQQVPLSPGVRVSTTPSAAVQQQQEAAYVQKLEEANRRKAERDKRMAERDKTIQGLPKPP